MVMDYCIASCSVDFDSVLDRSILLFLWMNDNHFTLRLATVHYRSIHLSPTGITDTYTLQDLFSFQAELTFLLLLHYPLQMAVVPCLTLDNQLKFPTAFPASYSVSQNLVDPLG